jgi:hypothetical protein
MRNLARVLICIFVVSNAAQSWAAPMLCQSDIGVESTELAHGHGGGHEHHADTHHDSSAHEPSSTHEQSSNDCASDCECSDCVVTVALSENEFASVATYRGERAEMCDGHLGPYLNGIFRPPIPS